VVKNYCSCIHHLFWETKQSPYLSAGGKMITSVFPIMKALFPGALLLGQVPFARSGPTGHCEHEDAAAFSDRRWQKIDHTRKWGGWCVIKGQQHMIATSSNFWFRSGVLAAPHRYCGRWTGSNHLLWSSGHEDSIPTFVSSKRDAAGVVRGYHGGSCRVDPSFEERLASVNSSLFVLFVCPRVSPFLSQGAAATWPCVS